MSSKYTKYFILWVFFILLWLPMLQDNLHIFKKGELKGAYTLPSDFAFDFKPWFNGSYAENKGEFLKSCFGLRPDFVRIYNQLKYWFFRTSVNERIVIGKENYLYEQNYIDEYYGTNYVGEDEIAKKVGSLKEIQDTLASRGILFFTVFAPGKGSFYPEYIPDSEIKPTPKHTNYSSYISLCNKAQVNFIDFRAWFQAMKDTSRYRLFPRCGVHWSIYGDYLAADSLVRYVEAKTGKDLPDLKIDSIQLSTRPRNRDYDAGDGLNLITEFFTDTLAYPYFSVSWQGKYQLSNLTIGDSYYWVMTTSTSPAVFKEVDFWYYFTDYWSLNNHTASKDNLKDALYNHQVVCLMYTDASLSGFGSKFLETALEQFHQNK